jgi:hypothetical protein
MVTKPMRGSLIDLTSIWEISFWIKSATFSERFPSMQTFFGIDSFNPRFIPLFNQGRKRGGLYRDDFDFCMHHFDQVHLLDKVDDFIQTGVDMSSIVPHGAETNLCPLPEVIVPNL